MNMNLKLDFDLQKLLPVLRKVQPYVFGLLLIGAFGYTAFVVNRSLNVGPGDASTTAASPAPRITFDKKTIEAVKKLEVVEGSAPTGSLGTSDPFR